MKDQFKQEFTRRITCANKTQLVVIMFEMFHQEVNDAVEYCKIGNYANMHAEITRSRNIVSELINSLDMSYNISRNLYAIYRFVEKKLIESDVRREESGLKQADALMLQLHDSFEQVAKLDTDGPMMANSEPVYAGMTYGRDNIIESSGLASRGYLA